MGLGSERVLGEESGVVPGCRCDNTLHDAKSIFGLQMETCSAGARGHCCALAKLGSQELFTALPPFFFFLKR